MEKDNEVIENKGLQYEIKKVVITVLTGLHIGGSRETKIGGVDSPVIKIYDEELNMELPYIPGSSLKGKLRALLEEYYQNRDKEEIKLTFGTPAGDNQNNWHTLIFRDLFLSKKIIERLKEMDYEQRSDFLYEVKFENTINRESGKSENLRQIERVNPGIIFEGEIVIRYKDNEELNKSEEILDKGVELLEKDYLGGNGTRGYGRITIEIKD